MQLYALNHQGKWISAALANRKTNYFCFECRGIVRVRSGEIRKPHFFHIALGTSCRSSQKSVIHWQIQFYLRDLLPGNIEIEKPFPVIKRIADVAWIEKKIIFEIQCSPISHHEVQERNADYRSLGWEVVWILHTRCYGGMRLCNAEKWLQESTHYFTDLDENMVGSIYDMFCIIKGFYRLEVLKPFPINPSIPVINANFRTQFRATWKLSFAGDCLDVLSSPTHTVHSLCSQLQQLAAINHSKKTISFRYIFLFIFKKVLFFYRAIFRFFLEKACR